jgi:hypothetical protein
MERFSRRTVTAEGGAVTTAGTGYLSGGKSTPSPDVGTIAESTTPGSRQPLPMPVAGDPDAGVTVVVYESVSDAIDSARAG